MDKNIATLIAKIIAVAAIAVIGSASTTNSTNRCHHHKPRRSCNDITKR